MNPGCFGVGFEDINLFYLNWVGLLCIHVCPQGKLEPFLSIAGQTLESFIKSLDEDAKPQQSYNSHEHHFVLALAGVVTSEGTEFVLNTSSI